MPRTHHEGKKIRLLYIVGEDGRLWSDFWKHVAGCIPDACRSDRRGILFLGWQHPAGIWVKAEGDVGIRVFPEMFF